MTEEEMALAVEALQAFDYKALRCWRKERGLNQEDMGRLLNVSRRAVSKWETGVNKMPKMTYWVCAYLSERENEDEP